MLSCFTRPLLLFWWLSLSLLLVSNPVAALAVPPLKQHVNDLAQLLSQPEAQALEQKLSQYEAATSNQFVLLTVPSLEGDVLEDFSLRVVESWQLGQKQQDNGLLLLVAKADRKMRFEVGYGLEGNIPDALAGRIIRDGLAPAFSRGDFAGGILLAFDAAMEAASGKQVSLPQRVKREPSALPRIMPLLLLGLFLLLGLTGRGGGFMWFLLAMLGGGRGGRGGRHGGGFGGGFGGGGFGGGGGGFGGGGASGNW